MEPRKTLFFFCSVFALSVHLKRASAGECPADGRTWVPFGNKCYHFVHGEEDQIKSYTFEAAHSHCRGFGLLTIQSAEENEFVMSYSPEVWKGNVNIWLGMKYDIDDDTMKWSNNQSVRFTNWEYSPSPPDLPLVDICVALHSSSGRWENVSCQDDVENGVVCETSLSEEQPRPKPSAVVSALVILSVVAVVGVSAVIWFLHQKHSFGSTMITAFEYHPPFRVLDSDESCLVEAEETQSSP
ncbi:PREDICTED: CD302 antigen [Cyprinodon variegatus]|uniref:CD302 molecule n=1 Tax=Cyprinodon variegatus TaxID=28743 RepID=A0A3Q2C8N7_CYPVA|nr:PREDICTED: CD302 antigen [Cyprinodon variegatus]